MTGSELFKYRGDDDKVIDQVCIYKYRTDDERMILSSKNVFVIL